MNGNADNTQSTASSSSYDANPMNANASNTQSTASSSLYTINGRTFVHVRPFTEQELARNEQIRKEIAALTWPPLDQLPIWDMGVIDKKFTK